MSHGFHSNSRWKSGMTKRPSLSRPIRVLRLRWSGFCASFMSPHAQVNSLIGAQRYCHHCAPHAERSYPGSGSKGWRGAAASSTREARTSQRDGRSGPGMARCGKPKLTKGLPVRSWDRTPAAPPSPRRTKRSWRRQRDHEGRDVVLGQAIVSGGARQLLMGRFRKPDRTLLIEAAERNRRHTGDGRDHRQERSPDPSGCTSRRTQMHGNKATRFDAESSSRRHRGRPVSRTLAIGPPSSSPACCSTPDLELASIALSQSRRRGAFVLQGDVDSRAVRRLADNEASVSFECADRPNRLKRLLQRLDTRVSRGQVGHDQRLGES
jgi:hypothetical protein